MNPSTGHLIDLERRISVPFGYEILPEPLQKLAKLKLNGNSEVQVNLRSNSKLAKWAKEKRKKQIAKKSKKANRK